MNTEQITLDECRNDGRHIHLYHDEGTNVWIAYGYSAYSLRLYVKKHRYDCLRSFSYVMQMPCTLIPDQVVHHIRKTEKLMEEHIGTYVLFEMPAAVDMTDYLQWVSKLRETRFDRDGMDTETPVSRFVPKDVFIKDGMSAFTRNTKRISDCVLAFVAMLIFSPLFLICWIAIRLDDGGPAIFRQLRILPRTGMIP